MVATNSYHHRSPGLHCQQEGWRTLDHTPSSDNHSCLDLDIVAASTSHSQAIADAEFHCKLPAIAQRETSCCTSPKLASLIATCQLPRLLHF